MQKRKIKDRIKSTIDNKDKIAIGAQNHMNFDNLDEDLKTLITDRRNICALCPNSSKNATEDGWYNSLRPDNHCVLCDCNINWKTASPDSECGAAIYNAENNENLEVKW